MDSDFVALTGERAAIRRCPNRGIIRVTGGDRVRFLDGMLSQDVGAIREQESGYATLLDRKGHILADLHVVALVESIVLDIAADRADTIYENLDKHLIADDVELVNLSASWSQVAFEGPEVGTSPGIPALARNAVLPEGELLWLATGTLTDTGVKLVGPAEAVALRCDALAYEAGWSDLSPAHAEVLRLEAGLPLYGVDMSDRNFPAEAQILSAVSFTKGCYIGQEIVARIESRGAVNKLLVPLRAETPVEPAMEIRSGEKAIGEVTSAAVSPAHGPLAMGYVRREYSEAGAEVEIAGVHAVVATSAEDSQR